MIRVGRIRLQLCVCFAFVPPIQLWALHVPQQSACLGVGVVVHTWVVHTWAHISSGTCVLMTGEATDDYHSCIRILVRPLGQDVAPGQGKATLPEGFMDIRRLKR